MINCFDIEQYLQVNPDVKESIEKNQFKSGIEYLEKYGLEEIRKGEKKFHLDFEPFNEEKYLKLFTDVKKAVEKGNFKSGFEHFCLFGYKEIIDGLRNWPKAERKKQNIINSKVIKNFNEEIYLLANPDVKEAIEKGEIKNGFEHLKIYGLEEIKKGFRKFHPDLEPFSEELYLNNFPDIKKAVEKGDFKSGFEHFCFHGYNEILNNLRNWPKLKKIETDSKINEEQNINNKNLIDENNKIIKLIEQYYEFFKEDFCNYNLGINLKSEKFIEKYNDFYKQTGNYPRISLFFDPNYYLDINKDVANANIDPHLHFLTTGIFEFRNPHPLIDLNYIINIKKYKINNVSDLINYIQQNNQTSPYFDSEYYYNIYPDIKEAGLIALEHYIMSGGFEKRLPNAFFDYDIYAEERNIKNLNGLEILIDFIMYGDFHKIKFSQKFDYIFYENQLKEKNIIVKDMPLFYHYVSFSKKFKLLPKPKLDFLKENQFASQKIYYSLKKDLDKLKKSKNLSLEIFNIKDFDNDYEKIVEQFSFSKEQTPEVSIVIPVYNAFKELIECLMSIDKYLKNEKFEIIIADDNSPDKRIQKFFQNNEKFIYIKNEKNLGFLKNVNNAIKKANGKYILLLNSDVQLLDNIIQILKNELINDPNVAVVGPKILFPNGTLQEAGCTIKKDCSTEMIGLGDDPNDNKYNIKRYVDYISGACWLFEKQLFEEMNGFDEELAPAYAEDLDFCARVIKNGRKILYSPKSCIVHHLSVSSESYSSYFKYYQSAVNKEKFIKKHGTFFKNYSKIKPIAFYLPQYHEIKQNSYWWGKGYTEWRAAANAKPQFKNHYQPHIPGELGFYDLTNPESFEKQAVLAKKFGLYGFCFYYYNFGEFELMEKALETFVFSKADINFCLCWANENWTKKWDGLEKDVLLEQKATDNNEIFEKVLKDMERFIKDKRYIKVDGKPLVLIYRPFLFSNIKEKIKRWRDYWKKEYGEDLYLCVVDSMERAQGTGEDPKNLGFDAAIEFPVHYVENRIVLEEKEILSDKNFEGLLIDYLEAVKEICKRKVPIYKRFPGVFPSWDNTPRRDNKSTIFKNSHPSAFQVFLETKIKESLLYSGDERMIFINAWNEWGEGAHLEPDLKYGNSWLQIIEKVVKEN